MINTIFYFPNSLTFEEYTEMLAGGDIAPRTIVFADTQKSIYKNGKKYGDISEQKFHSLLDAVENDSWISDELDGIKGDIIRNRDALSNLDTLIDQSIQGIQSDITEANQRISSLNNSISTVNSNLNTAISNRDTAIQTKVENLFDNAEWLSENFPQRQTSWDSNWNSELESYLTQVGYWDIDSATGQKTAKWSKLQNDINSISLEIANLTGNETSSQSLTTAIESMIEDNIAALNLNTTYATISSVNGINQTVQGMSSDLNNSKNVIEWLYSGLKASSAADKTFTELSSMTKSAFTSAISDIRTQVDKVANGDFVAQTEVSAKVGNAISTMLAQASGDNALATLAAKADTNSDNIAALVLGMTGSTSTANLSTSVSTALGNLTSGLASTSDITSAKSEIYSAISAKDSNDNFISLAALKTQSDADHAQVSLLATNKADASGVVAKSELGTAVASLFASTGDAQNPTAKANVVAVVKDNKSQLNLTAQDVNIDGYLTGGSASFKGDVEATSFTTGASNEVGITVLAGEFDPTDPNVNTHKAYFAYDSEQGGVTMYFYCNNAWKRIDLSNASVSEDPNAFDLVVLYTGTVFGNYLLSDQTFIRTYYNRVYDKYYSTTSAIDANLLNATGYYFSDGWIPRAPSEYSWMYREDPTINMDMHGVAMYIPAANVTSNLNLGQTPLYIFPPRLLPIGEESYNSNNELLNGLDDGNNISTTRIYKKTYQDGVQSDSKYRSYFYVADEVLWHASGDPLPSGIIAQNSQTPSVNDEFAYVVWKIGDHTAIVKNMSAGDTFCIAGGNGNIYEASTLGKQIVYQVSPWVSYFSNTARSYTVAQLQEAGLSSSFNDVSLLNLDNFIKSDTYSGASYIDPNHATTVAHIWHCIPDVPYTYPRTQPEQSSN